MTGHSEAAERLLHETEIEARASELRERLEAMRAQVEVGERRLGADAMKGPRARVEELEALVEKTEARVARIRGGEEA